MHASVFVTPTTLKGVVFQRRDDDRRRQRRRTPGPGLTAPVWLRLSRSGNQVAAFYRTSSTGEWAALGIETFSRLDEEPVESSDSQWCMSTARSRRRRSTCLKYPAAPAARMVARGYRQRRYLGERRGEQYPDAARVTGSGADIWGTADEFHWAFRSATGDFSIQTLVDSVRTSAPYQGGIDDPRRQQRGLAACLGVRDANDG